MKCMTAKCENETDNEIDFNGNRLVFCDDCIDDLNHRIGINYADFLVRRHLIAHAVDAEKADDNTACGREGGAAPYTLRFHHTTTD